MSALKISFLVRGWAAAAPSSARTLSSLAPSSSTASASFQVRTVLGGFTLAGVPVAYVFAVSDTQAAPSAPVAPTPSVGSAHHTPHGSIWATSAYIRETARASAAIPGGSHVSHFHSSASNLGSFSSPGGSSGAHLHPHPLHLSPAVAPQGAAAGAGAGAGWQSWAAPGGRGSSHPGRRFFASPTRLTSAAAVAPARTLPLLACGHDGADEALYVDDEPRLCVP